MAPAPTLRAMLSFLGCASLQLVGLWEQTPLLIWLGSAGLMGISLCLALTLRAGQRLRELRMEFGWDASANSAADGLQATLGHSRVVHGYFQNHGEESVVLVGLRPAVPEAITVRHSPQAVRAEARSRTEFAMEVRGAAIGRWVMRGLSVSVPGPLELFLAPLYFPTPLSLRVLPHRCGSAQPGHRLPTDGGEAGRPLGPTSARSAEFRELRVLQPGEPYHAIAWKPSARRGQLLSRVHEQDSERILMVVVDVGASMRRGVIGQRPLDKALELSAALLDRALVAGDRAGLVTVDTRIVDHLPAVSGTHKAVGLYQALIAANHVVDQDLTGVDEAEVQALVLRYLRRQEGLPSHEASAPQLRRVNQRLLAQAVRLAIEEDDHRPTVGNSSQDVLLRRFCRRHGISLPYRSRRVAEQRDAALAMALRLAAGSARTPRDIVLVLGDIGAGGGPPMQRALTLLHTRRHRLQAVLPTSLEPRSSPTSPQTAETALSVLARLRRAREREHLKRWLARAGCTCHGLPPHAAILPYCADLERSRSARLKTA